MMKMAQCMVVALALVALVGCAQVMSPLTGVIYTEVSGPITATSAERGSKTGVAEATSILGILATGDASIAAAARNGGISQIKTVDYDATNILGLYATFTTRVTGN